MEHFHKGKSQIVVSSLVFIRYVLISCSSVYMHVGLLLFFFFWFTLITRSIKILPLTDFQRISIFYCKPTIMTAKKKCGSSPFWTLHVPGETFSKLATSLYSEDIWEIIFIINLPSIQKQQPLLQISDATV